MELILGALKMVAILIAGTIGSVAIVSDLRSKSGKLNRWGIGSVVAIIISTLAALLIQMFELQKEQTDILKSQQRTEKLLFQISRNIQLIRTVKIGFWLGFPINNSHMGKYRKELNTAIDGYLAERKSITNIKKLIMESQNADFEAGVVNSDWSPIQLKVKPDGALQPTPGDYPNAHSAMFSTPLSFRFYKNPIGPIPYSLTARHNYEADWRFNTMSFLADEDKSRKGHEIYVDTKNRTVQLFGSSVPAESLWDSTGKIASLVDLQGAQLFIVTPGKQEIDLFPGKSKDKFGSLRQQITIETISLNFGRGLEIWLYKNDFTILRNKHGNATYMYQFPETVEAFSKLFHKTRKDINK